MKINESCSKWLIAAFLLLSSFEVTAEYGAIPMPESMHSVWVGQDIVQNGIPMQIQSFTYGGSVENLLAYYKNQWENTGQSDIPGFVEQEVGGWAIISHLENTTNTVVQAKSSDDGGAEGYISQATLGAKSDVKEIIRDFPKMSGSDVISATESSDSNREATTLIFSNHFSVESNTVFYKSKMKALGWSYVHGAEQGKTSILLFNGEGTQTEIAISKNENGMTIIFANVVNG